MTVKHDDKEFFKTLSDDEWDYAEAVADLAHILCPGLTEYSECQFLRAAMEKKRAHPNPDPPAIEILNAGLAALGKPLLTPTRKRKLKGKLAGVGA